MLTQRLTATVSATFGYSAVSNSCNATGAIHRLDQTAIDRPIEMTAESFRGAGKFSAQPLPLKNRELLPQRRKDAKFGKKDSLSFRPQGEIFLRSLAFARDDGRRPVTFAPLRLGGR